MLLKWKSGSGSPSLQVLISISNLDYLPLMSCNDYMQIPKPKTSKTNLSKNNGADIFKLSVL